MVYPANGLRGFVSGLDLSEFGKGPGHSTSEPLYRCTQVSPTTSNIQQYLDAANTYDMRLIMNWAGARGSWTNPGPIVNGLPTLTYDPAKYEANVRRFQGNANIAAAIASGKVISFAVDEPFLTVFNGSIPKSAQNDMGLLIKSIFPGTLVAMRSPSNQMIPPPAGGWTGIDYGWSQWARTGVVTGLTPRQWWAQEKAAFTSINCGMIPANNWINGGDGRLWDYLNNGTSVGRIQGDDGVKFWLQSPAEIMEKADAIFDDPDALGFLGYTFCDSNFVANFIQYQERSDFVAAFDYQLTKMASRPVWNGLRVAKGTHVATGLDYTASVAVNGRVTTQSGTYTDVPGAIVTSNNLTPGRSYLVVAAAAIDIGTVGSQASVQMVHGTTQLNRSESSFATKAIGDRQGYFWWGVITTVAGQDIKVQFKNSDGVTTIGADLCQIFAMNIGDSFTQGTDYVFAENATATALSTTYQDGAGVTINPASAGDWLVLTSAHFKSMPTTSSVVTGLRRGGEAAGTDPEVQQEGASATLDKYRLGTAKVVTVSANTNTFTEHSKNSTGSGGTRDGSAVFALRLAKFVAYGFAYDTTPLDLAATNFATNVGQAFVNTPADCDMWALGSFGWDANSLTGVRARLSIDDFGDTPPGATTAAYGYQRALDTTDACPVMLSGVGAVSAGFRTVFSDASAVAAATGRAAINRMVLGVNLVLAPGVGITNFSRRSGEGIGTRTGTRRAR